MEISEKLANSFVVNISIYNSKDELILSEFINHNKEDI
jgi:hypothetical protein